jgi:TRAP-type C4-dicarboxylate transport system substrate-binding protein
MRSMKSLTAVRARRSAGLVAVLALTLAACGGGESSAPAPTPVPAPAPAPADDGPEEITCDAPVTLTYASNVPEGGLIEAGTEWWIAEVETRSNGCVLIEAFFGGSLLGGAQIFDGLIDGIIDIGHVSQSRVNASLPFWGVTGLPFLTTDPTATQRAISELLASNEEFAAQFERLGLKPLYVKPIPTEVSGFSSPVTTLADFNGLRLRGLGRWANAAYAALGADLVDVNSPEIFEATQRGTINGWTQQTLDIAVGNSLHEVAPYFVDAGIGTVFPVGNVMRLESFNALSPELQALIEQINLEYVEASVANAAAIESGFCDTLLASGGSVTVIPAAEVDAWKANVQADIIALWTESVVELTGVDRAVVEQFYNDYVEAVRRYEAESTYVNGLRACAERR